MKRIKHTEGMCACGSHLTCPARIGAKGGASTSPAKVKAARANARKGRTLYRCACGARGRQIARWKTADGRTHTKCRECGKSSMKRRTP